VRLTGVIEQSRDLQIRRDGCKLRPVIEETISRIEERLRAADTLTPLQRAELEGLLEELRREARSLPPDALPESPSDEDVRSTISRLEESLTAFETSHPQITGLVNRISTILANMGI
jgi:hypothetical protein